MIDLNSGVAQAIQQFIILSPLHFDFIDVLGLIVHMSRSVWVCVGVGGCECVYNNELQ